MPHPTSRDIAKSGTSPVYDADWVPLISVMLPTFKRSEALRRTLVGLERQTLATDLYEIVVVDDGSQDGTGHQLEEFAQETTCRFSYVILVKNGGPARARNFGLARCRGEITLIIGDDIEPDKHLLEKHLQFHQQNPELSHALLGRVTFPERLEPSCFMKWLEDSGRKYFFNYRDLSSGQRVGPQFFYTCNVSVKMALLDRSGWFDESFPYASHEDLELGYRLAQKGMHMVYDAGALGYHWHMLSEPGIARRIYLMGYSAAIFWQKVDDRGGYLKRALRNLITWFASLPASVSIWQKLREKAYSTTKRYPTQWHILLFLSFFIGLSDARRHREVRV